MHRAWIIIIGGAILCGATVGYYFGTIIMSPSRDTGESSSVVGVMPEGEAFLHETIIVADLDKAPDRTLLETANKQPVLFQERQVVAGVEGAVRRPGVYRFREGDRVHHGIVAAGGALPEADMEDINIAAKLLDNTALYVPFQLHAAQEKHSIVARRTMSASEANPAVYTRSGWIYGAPRVPVLPAGASGGPPRQLQPETQDGGAASTLIHLNRASPHELEQLPGIGPKTAEKIDAYRQLQPFRTIDELMEVHGIGPKKLEAVRHLVTVD